MLFITSYSVVQLLTLVVYIALIFGVVRYARTRLKKYFMVFLISSAAWSLVSLMANLQIPFEQAVFWGKMVAPLVASSLFFHALFITAFTNRGTGKLALFGSIYVAAIIGLVIAGYMPEKFILLENGIVHKDYGESLVGLSIGSLGFMIVAASLLVKSFRASNSPEHQNRIMYLLAGLACMVVFGIIWKVIPVQSYAVDHIGHLGNALIITYAIQRHQLLDMKLVVRKGLVYSGITLFISVACLLLVTSLNYLLRVWSAPGGVVATVALVVGIACLYNPLKAALEKGAARLFYGKTYDYRQMLLNFASRMSNVLELKELADAMLAPLTNALHASQVSLLFSSNGSFSSHFAERYMAGDPVIPLKFRKDSPIVTWLSNEDRPLTRETIEFRPEFKGLWQEERDNLNAAQVELLCPLKSKQKLVAILALSKKYPRGFYSRDDTDMLMTLSHEAAIAIENAYLYERARQRANTDELTGLFNHRFFHQRLDEEIARSSRFGAIFSLILIDIDLFKTYNDVSGHLAGDEMLKQVGTHVKESVRDTDICFRYGGDEFAIILPEAPLEGGRKVAERIRKGMEARMDLKGIPLTCSIGIASWPTDGVMREEIIQAADAALYYAKHVGKNRTCLACEVALSEVIRIGSGTNSRSSRAILSTIYALAATVDAKDHYTYGHSKKVSKYATDIAEAIGYSREDIERIRAAALLHDIGKIGVSDRLLKKSAALTPDEWDLVRAHPNLGVSIIKHIDSLRGCLAAVQYHHENYDGTGYPAGLNGENIPLDARIMAIADAYDAMTSERPYRQKRTAEDALAELRRCAGTQFDPNLVKVFTGLMAKSVKPEVRPRRKLQEDRAIIKQSVVPSDQNIDSVKTHQ